MFHLVKTWRGVCRCPDMYWLSMELHTNLTRMVLLLKRDSTPRGATVAGLALLQGCLTQSGAG